MKTHKLFHRVFSLFGLDFCLSANHEALISDDEFFLGKGEHLHSLLSNFHTLKENTFQGNHDFHIFLLSEQGLPFQGTVQSRFAFFAGDLFTEMKRQTDKRSWIFGNMGIFSKIVIKALEERGIFSFHSTSFFDEGKNRLYLVLGGSGAGKSTVCLEAVERGFLVFGTELTHFSINQGQVIFQKGSLYQNTRMSNVVYNFPWFIKRFGLTNLPETEPWKHYRSINFKEFATKQDVLENPDVIVIIPRIEDERKTRIVEKKDAHGLDKIFFDNLCEKVSPPSWVYKRFFIPSIDCEVSINSRVKAAFDLSHRQNIKAVWNILASPNHCLKEALLD